MELEEREERLKRYKQAFDDADAAAAKGDARGVMAALLQPHVFSGLVYRLEQFWQRNSLFAIGKDDTDAIIAEKLRAIYELIVDGKHLSGKIGAYLFKACRNRGFEIQRIRGGHHGQVPLDSVAHRTGKAPETVDPKFEDWNDVARRLIRLVRRTIIPTLGGGNVQKVMDFIFEALEKGVTATNEEIARALGVSVENVRVWKSRGFQKLPDRLKKAGLLPADDRTLEEILGDVGGDEEAPEDE